MKVRRRSDECIEMGFRRPLKMASIGLEPVHTTPFSNETDTVLYRIRLPSTLQRRKRSAKKEQLKKRSPEWNDLKTVLFEDAVFIV